MVQMDILQFTLLNLKIIKMAFNLWKLQNAKCGNCKFLDAAKKPCKNPKWTITTYVGSEDFRGCKLWEANLSKITPPQAEKPKHKETEKPKKHSAFFDL